MQTIKKKKVKTAKKHKHLQSIEHTTDTSINETQITQTSISEQAHIEHKTTSTKTHEQSIRQIPLDVAPQQIESILFDEKTLPMDSATGPKPIETQPIFHAQYAQVASAIESETLIHSTDAPVQRCSVSVNEIMPLVISQIDESECVESKRPDKIAQSLQLSPKIITSSATIADQVVPCDNVNTFESKMTPAMVVAESSSIPHDDKLVCEQVFSSQKEEELTATYAPDFKRAHETICMQCPIEVHAVDVGESEKNILENYEPAMQSATLQMVSNTAFNTEETLTQNTPAKFYPEMIIATEVATTKFIEQFPYQTHEMCTSETENILHLPDTASNKQAHVEFSDLHAITMEQTDVSEREAPSHHVVPDSLKAFAQDTITLQKEIQTGFCQAIESVRPSESIPCALKTAAVSMTEMDGKQVEIVNVLQNEQAFESAKPLLQQEANEEYISHEGLTISEALVQESNVEFSSTLNQTPANAMQTREEQKIAAQSDELLFETASDYQRTDVEPNMNAQVNFEPQRSIILDTVVTNDSERSFDVNLQTKQPHYSMDTGTHSSILVSETDIHEESTELLTEPVSHRDTRTTFELHKTYCEQTDVQVYSTTDEHRSNDKVPLQSAQVSFELQKSAIGESVSTHDVEQTFESQLKSNVPHYTTETNEISPIMVTETHAQESDGKLLHTPVASTTAMVTQELYKVHESSTDQTLETIDDCKGSEKHPEHSANVLFELQQSAIGEVTMANDTEQSLVQPVQKLNQPKLSIAENSSGPVIVSETHAIDTESPFRVAPSDGEHLNISICPKQYTHAGAVSQTQPYDTVEAIQPSTEKVGSAKIEQMVCHEVAVEMTTTSESFDQFKADNWRDEQKHAAPAIVTKTALNVSVEQTAELLDKFEETTINKEHTMITHDVVPTNPIIINEIETSEHTTRFETESTKLSVGNVKMIEHGAANISETWPIESVGTFTKTAIKPEESLERNLIRSTAIQSTTVIATDTFTEFTDQMQQTKHPKYLIDESCSIQTEDIISQENAEQHEFHLIHEPAQGHIVHDFEVNKRCEQAEQIAVESTESLQSTKSGDAMFGTKTVSDVLTAAKVAEVISNQSSDTFECKKPEEYRGKPVQDNFNVAGQLAQQMPLERESLLADAVQIKGEHPNKSIEGQTIYATSQTEPLEKEYELKTQHFSETQSVNKTMEPLLSTSYTSEDTILSHAVFGIESAKNYASQTAVSKIERLLEGLYTEDKIINETTSDTITISSKAATAMPAIETKQSVQIEIGGTYEKEDELYAKVSEPKTCDLNLGDNLKVATSQVTELIEQTQIRTDYKLERNVATELATEVNQNLIYEGVYLEASDNMEKIARTSETPTHAVKVIEHIPLYKETTIDEKQTDKLLIKPLLQTQEKTELNSAQIQCEINVQVKNTDEKNTNQKKVKKSKETTIFEKGRSINQTHSFYYRIFRKMHFR